MVSGGLPLIEALDMVRERHPHLLGHIYNEIAGLSKISFFFIQDMALNRSAYTGSNIEINLAAAFGMIKKRPERVVGMLQNHMGQSGPEIRKGIEAFIKKAKQILTMEGRGFEEAFLAAGRKAEAVGPAETGGILRSFFHPPTH
nr:hypothetical protein [Desulfobacula sp.]